MHQVGELVRYEGRIWRVGLINESRMRLDPVQGQIARVSQEIQFTEYGSSVNVSPGAFLEKVTPESLKQEQLDRVNRLKMRDEDAHKERKMAAVSPVPVEGGEVAPTVGKNRTSNKERLAALKAKKAETKTPTTAKSAKPAKEKAAKAPAEKKLKPCVCGCGEQVTGYFAQGHDARFKGWLLKVERGQMKVEELPKVVQKSFEWKKKGDGYIPTTNYKGEKHTGYDKTA